MDVEDMRSAAEERDRLADEEVSKQVDRDMRQALDLIYNWGWSRLNDKKWSITDCIRRVALDMRQPYRGKHLEVKLSRDPITGQMTAEIVERRP